MWKNERTKDVKQLREAPLRKLPLGRATQQKQKQRLWKCGRTK